MSTTRRAALTAALLTLPGLAHAQQPAPPVRLFRVVTAREEITMGFTPAELAALGGEGPEVARIASALMRDGQVTGWRYVVTRAPDGGTRLAARDRVAVMRRDSVLVEPYAAALPVAPPPAN